MPEEEDEGEEEDEDDEIAGGYDADDLAADEVAAQARFLEGMDEDVLAEVATLRESGDEVEDEDDDIASEDGGDTDDDDELAAQCRSFGTQRTPAADQIVQLERSLFGFAAGLNAIAVLPAVGLMGNLATCLNARMIDQCHMPWVAQGGTTEQARLYMDDATMLQGGAAWTVAKNHLDGIPASPMAVASWEIVCTLV